MDDNLRSMLDPAERLRTIMNSAVTEVNPAVPLNRYYRSLNEIYRVAGFCAKENDLERAFSLYLRFVCLAVEELPKHKDYKGFSSEEKAKAEASLRSALDNAEVLKVQLKEKFEEDAIKAKVLLEERKAVEARLASIVPPNEGSIVPSDYANRLPFSGPSHQLSQSLSDGATGKSCSMIIAGEIVEKFRKQVERNTSLNIETCAVLCGNMSSGGVYHVTHAVIPKQDGAPDSCDMHNEEEIFDFQDTHNLITLGWIHTHPSQTAFLSSVDLHTHCAYQLMLPEAIAIVVAPKFNQFGVFRLSLQGMEEVGSCRQSGFHPHENSNSLFYQCIDIQFNSKLNAHIVDLR